MDTNHNTLCQKYDISGQEEKTYTRVQTPFMKSGHFMNVKATNSFVTSQFPYFLSSKPILSVAKSLKIILSQSTSVFSHDKEAYQSIYFSNNLINHTQFSLAYQQWLKEGKYIFQTFQKVHESRSISCSLLISLKRIKKKKFAEMPRDTRHNLETSLIGYPWSKGLLSRSTVCRFQIYKPDETLVPFICLL